MTQPADTVARPRPAQSEAMTRERVAQLLSCGIRRVDIANTLGVSKSTVSYHARRLGADVDERCRRRYDRVAVQEYHDTGRGVRECAREFGFATSTWYAAVKRGLIVPRPSFRTPAELFAENTHRNRGHHSQTSTFAGRNGRSRLVPHLGG
jgi:hypothetical protein